jgi:hypothetical protein
VSSGGEPTDELRWGATWAGGAPAGRVGPSVGAPVRWAGSSARALVGRAGPSGEAPVCG